LEMFRVDEIVVAKESYIHQRVLVSYKAIRRCRCNQ
jgi:hypothetical protein